MRLYLHRSSQGRDGARTPMPWSADNAYGGFSTAEPWLPMAVEHVARAVAVQEHDTNSTLAITRRLLVLRKLHPPLRTGSFVALPLPHPLIGFDRIVQSDRVRCLFNLSTTTQQCPALKVGRVLFSSGTANQIDGVLGPLSASWLAVD